MVIRELSAGPFSLGLLGNNLETRDPDSLQGSGLAISPSRCDLAIPDGEVLGWDGEVFEPWENEAPPPLPPPFPLSPLPLPLPGHSHTLVPSGFMS